MVAEPLDKKRSIPEFRPGDTVRVAIKVVEGDSERIQVFEGTVISRRGSGTAQTFTVRKVSFGVGVERTFPLFSPHIDRIDVTKSGRVRRARLYYLRQLSGKAARVNEQEMGGGSGGEAKPSQQASSEASTPPPKPETDHKARAAKPSSEPRAFGAAPARQ